MKKELLKIVIEQLNRQYKTLLDAAKDAKDAATNEESKAESKYDTRGLEASYLAGAQAMRAAEIEHTINMMTDLLSTDLKPSSQVIVTSVVRVSIDDETTQSYFILPQVGGLTLEYNNEKFRTVSPESPLGENLIDRKVGYNFEFQMKNQIREYEIIEIL